MISLDDESDLEEDSDSEDDVVENLGKMQETLRKMRQTWSSLSLATLIVKLMVNGMESFICMVAIIAKNSFILVKL